MTHIYTYVRGSFMKVVEACWLGTKGRAVFFDLEEWRAVYNTVKLKIVCGGAIRITSFSLFLNLDVNYFQMYDTTRKALSFPALLW